jgi:hypothetical protein
VRRVMLIVSVVAASTVGGPWIGPVAASTIAEGTIASTSVDSGISADAICTIECDVRGGTYQAVTTLGDLLEQSKTTVRDIHIIHAIDKASASIPR